MRPEWDETKRAANFVKHGIDFSLTEQFNFEGARISPDERRNYGESRFIALGFVGTREYVLIFAMRGEAVRVISMRKANTRESKSHGQT